MKQIFRIDRDAPRLATLMLCVATATELARGGLALRAEPAAPADSAAVPAPASKGLDTGRILAAHLFGVADAAAPLQELHAAQANLRLDGTLATEDPAHGMAIIHDGRSPRFFLVGGQVDGASLQSVYRDYVILNRGGVLEILRLPRLAAALQRSALPAPAQVGGDAARGYFVDSQGRAVDQRPERFDGLIRTVQTMDEQTGKMRGFVVYPVGSGTPLRLLGLSPADLITAINGTPLDDPKRARQILVQIQSSDSASVTIERQNQRMDVVLNIAAAIQDKPTAMGEEP